MPRQIEWAFFAFMAGRVICAGFTGLKTVMSVFAGYCHAVDGYASIIVIFTVWEALRRRKIAA